MPRVKTVYSKVFSTPRRPYEKERLDQELKLIGEYGLRNKREVWRVKYTLAHIRKAARELLTLEEKDQRRLFEGIHVHAWGWERDGTGLSNKYRYPSLGYRKILLASLSGSLFENFDGTTQKYIVLDMSLKNFGREFILWGFLIFPKNDNFSV